MPGIRGVFRCPADGCGWEAARCSAQQFLAHYKTKHESVVFKLVHPAAGGPGHKPPSAEQAGLKTMSYMKLRVHVKAFQNRNPAKHVFVSAKQACGADGCSEDPHSSTCHVPGCRSWFASRPLLAAHYGNTNGKRNDGQAHAGHRLASASHCVHVTLSLSLAQDTPAVATGAATPEPRHGKMPAAAAAAAAGGRGGRGGRGAAGQAAASVSLAAPARGRSASPRPRPRPRPRPAGKRGPTGTAAGAATAQSFAPIIVDLKRKLLMAQLRKRQRRFGPVAAAEEARPRSLSPGGHGSRSPSYSSSRNSTPVAFEVPEWQVYPRKMTITIHVNTSSESDSDSDGGSEGQRSSDVRDGDGAATPGNSDVDTFLRQLKNESKSTAAEAEAGGGPSADSGSPARAGAPGTASTGSRTASVSPNPYSAGEAAQGHGPDQGDRTEYRDGTDDEAHSLDEELRCVSDKMFGLEEEMQATQQSLSEHDMRIRALKKQLNDTLKAKASIQQANAAITSRLALPD